MECFTPPFFMLFPAITLLKLHLICNNVQSFQLPKIDRHRILKFNLPIS